MLEDLSQKDAVAAANSISGDAWTVVGRKEQIRSVPPPPPYTTADLLVDSIERLRISSDAVMLTAQRLYDCGLITYPRTDSTRVSSDASRQAQALIFANYGATYLPDSITFYGGAGQDAHEAIRPTMVTLLPESAPLNGLDKQIYELIWRRFVAAHMRPATIKDISVLLEVE